MSITTASFFPWQLLTWAHSRIASNTIRRLSERLDGRLCQVANSTARVRVSPTNYLYPDILVVCGKPVFTDEQQETITNPEVIVEVFRLPPPATIMVASSPSIADCRLFEEYLLIAQVEPRIDVFRKMPASRWVLSSHEGLENAVRLSRSISSSPSPNFYVEATP